MCPISQGLYSTLPDILENIFKLFLHEEEDVRKKAFIINDRMLEIFSIMKDPHKFQYKIMPILTKSLENSDLRTFPDNLVAWFTRLLQSEKPDFHHQLD